MSKYVTQIGLSIANSQTVNDLRSHLEQEIRAKKNYDYTDLFKYIIHEIDDGKLQFSIDDFSFHYFELEDICKLIKAATTDIEFRAKTTNIDTDPLYTLYFSDRGSMEIYTKDYDGTRLAISTMRKAESDVFSPNWPSLVVKRKMDISNTKSTNHKYVNLEEDYMKAIYASYGIDDLNSREAFVLYGKMAESTKEWMQKFGRYVEVKPCIAFAGSLFVFSGEVDSWGADANLHPIVKKIISRGGQYRSAVSGRTNYLVVTPRYADSQKIEEVLRQRKKGKGIKVILIFDLEKALA